MFAKTFIVTLLAALFAGQAMGIALDQYDACNCPRNCKKVVNSSCKFYSGPSDSSKVVNGRCLIPLGDNELVCQAQ